MAFDGGLVVGSHSASDAAGVRVETGLRRQLVGQCGVRMGGKRMPHARVDD